MSAISYILKTSADQTLSALIGVLKKGAAHAAEKGIPEENFLGHRLYPDMLPLTRQVQIACDMVARGASRLAGQDVVSTSDTETSFAELIARVETAKAHVASMDDAAIDANAMTILQIPMGPDTKLPMEGRQYLAAFVLPNLYFHATTAYDLLRMQGVVLGKRDFLNANS